MKTLDIKALSWLDKTYGNTYFSTLITIDFGMNTEKVYKLPFRYGYGESYIHEAKKLLIEFNQISPRYDQPLWQYCKENNIILRHSIHEAKKKQCIELVK